MTKKTYFATELAGPKVAGQATMPAGEPMLFTEEEAEQPVRQGYLSEIDPTLDANGKRKKA